VLTSVILVLYSALRPDILTFSDTTGQIFVHMSTWTIFSPFELSTKTLKIKIVTCGNLVQSWIANWQIFWTTKFPAACRRVRGNREMILQWRNDWTSEKKRYNGQNMNTCPIEHISC